MNRKVAIVKCDTYQPKEVYNALIKAFELLEIDKMNEFYNNYFILKPNLCLPTTPEAHLTTHPEVMRQLIGILNEKRNELRIGDTSIGYEENKRSERVWENTGMNQLLKEFGIKKVDFQQDIICKEVEISGEKYILPISRDVLENNIINVPKLKTHSYMLMTGCVKNFYGVLAGDAKKKFHHLIGTKEKFVKLLLAINNMLNNRLNVVDAIIGIEGEGPGAKGENRHVGLIVVGFDALLVDKVLAQLIGLRPNDILTNYYSNVSEPIILGEEVEIVKKDFKLPVVNPKSDRIIEHVIEAKSHHALIEEEKCRRCGLCYRNCPASSIVQNSNQYVISDDKCISCFVCIEVCPYGAIMVKKRRLFDFIKGEVK